MYSDPKNWLTLQQIAERCGVHYKTAHTWTKYPVRGRVLISQLVGGRRRVSPENLEIFLAGNEPQHDQQLGERTDADAATDAGKQLEKLLSRATPAEAGAVDSWRPPQPDSNSI